MIRRLICGLTAAVVVAALAGCGGGKAAETTPITPPPATEAPATGTEAKVAPVEMGQPATSGSWTLTAKTADRAADAGGASAASGQELLVITFDLTNGGTADEGIGPTSFKLAGPDGTEYQATPTSDPAFIFNTEQPIKAGETREIKIAYGVPTGTTPFQWTFEPFSASGPPQPAVINIK